MSESPAPLPTWVAVSVVVFFVVFLLSLATLAAIGANALLSS